MRDRLSGLAVVGAFVCFLGVPGPVPPLAASVSVSGAQPQSTGCSATLPYTLSHLGDSQQVVVVMSASWGSTHATLRTYELRAGNDWCRVLAPVKARIGYSGFAWAKTRKQSTGTTPAGTFALPWAFGNSPDPGTALRYRSVDGNDWWAYDPKSPATYNRWQEHGLAGVRASWAERLRSYGTQYAHAVVVDYNLPTATTRPNTAKGGGIFLHVNGPGATAGCVSVSRSNLIKVMRWLDPAKHPVIVMAPSAAITRA